MSLTTSDGTLVVDGEVDAHSAPELGAALARLIGAVDVDVDLATVSFMDSSGLRVLIEAHQQATAAKGRLVVHRPSAAVRRVIELGGLVDHLVVVDD